MTDSCVRVEPSSHVGRVVAEEPTDAECGGAGALVAPLVERVDRDAEEVGDLLDGQELLHLISLVLIA
jgi:hypothetical protein